MSDVASAHPSLTLMATSRDQPNPLRPYYKPPSIGLPPDPTPNATSAHHYASSSARGQSPSASPPKPSFGSQARDILSDLDYGVDLSLGDGSPSLAELTKKLLDQAVWNYTSVLFAQPFEVAKTLLQCNLAPGSEGPVERNSLTVDDARRRAENLRRAKYAEQYSDSDSGDDSPSYFSSTAPRPARSPSSSDSQSNSRPQNPSTASASRIPPSHPYKLDLKRTDSLLEALSQLWTKEGAWGIWKGTNSTFIYNFLLKTVESWTRSLLSALLNVPDPGLLGGYGVGGGGLDVVDSPNPIMSLAVAVTAAGITGLLLAPLDIVRTRLILTPAGAGPRNILPNLRTLPSFTVPAPLLPITLLHSTVPTLVSASTPIFLRSSLRIDPVLTPATYSLCTFLSSAAELFLKLPLETVLRRGQVSVLSEHARASADYNAHTTFRSQSRSSRRSRSRTESPRSPHPQKSTEEPFPTVVDVGPYKGVLGSMWFIVREEGSSGAVAPAPHARAAVAAAARAQAQRQSRGQGISGLWRGWRVGFWGLVGVWGAAAMGGAGGGEF
ncbi:uncharacterized protein K452DRAFT_252741 [Aplosporella prunicola CBS 121167]|uniref:Mitochondrial carrier n=1 Tax=Aplosporella prunicola CBS 121167 TaxID=1176127 RepID=A0A6A6B7L4_9PEZI|nr:uncharacterized protein K452DRAFT_252741 [Aplosporella prunicola CBS 121167]KAF2140119.1 hypothetical protein K452DRAFT_252741 [Aplosporella prunicola CBS 121167]